MERKRERGERGREEEREREGKRERAGGEEVVKSVLLWCFFCKGISLGYNISTIL